MASHYRSNAYLHEDPDPPFRAFLRRVWRSLSSLLTVLRQEFALLASSPSHRSSRWRTCRRATLRPLPWPPYLEVVLIMYWIHVLRWGEISQFPRSVANCEWSSWEAWSPDASPYRLILVADPQLVDPHTYPGRPWPLSTFTMSHTDQYLRRSFQSALDILDPSSVLFLGDLFDGGREWSTDEGSESPELRWRKYGETYWLKEYQRFSRIFVDPWAKTSENADTNTERRFRANLPGNHDLGISNGVQLRVRERFNTFFGEGNMMEVLANHTIVMLDTVSLTAKAAQDGANPDNKAIWDPPNTFLQNAKVRRQEVSEREMRRRNNLPENELLKPVVVDTGEHHDRAKMDLRNAPDFPAILLSHVPLYRAPGTPCGPLRENHPPSQTKDHKPLESDEPNAIKVTGGYQYQNVLHPEITEHILTSLGSSNIAHVFSGDDHDYCEVVHRGYTAPGGGIREITVKSMSWAMGVRHPGFLLVSLWNPLDTDGISLSKEPTVQTHSCLLPDQLNIFIFYGKIIAVSVTSCILVAIWFTIKEDARQRNAPTLLPLRNAKTGKDNDEMMSAEDSSCSSSSHSADGSLTSRVMTSRKGMVGSTVLERDWEKASYTFPSARSPTVAGEQRPWNKWRYLGTRFLKSLGLVALGAFTYYFWLAHTV